jgi:hypothetical protein
MNSLSKFHTAPFIVALKAFFEELKVPVNYASDFPANANEILKDTYKDNDNFQRMEDVYFFGIVEDAIFFDARNNKEALPAFEFFGQRQRHPGKKKKLPENNQFSGKSAQNTKSSIDDL